MTHYSNTSNPIDFPDMTKYVHIVQVHPVELGEPNLYKVKTEREFVTKELAEYWIELFDKHPYQEDGIVYKAVYLCRVNDDTGELE